MIPIIEADGRASAAASNDRFPLDASDGRMLERSSGRRSRKILGSVIEGREGVEKKKEKKRVVERSSVTPLTFPV